MTALSALFVSHSSGLGGAERVLLELLEGLDRSAVRPTIVVPGKGPLAEAAAGLDVPVLFHPAPWWLPFDSEATPGYLFRRYWEESARYARPLVRVITERHVDVVYSTSALILHAALAAHIARRPHVHHMQDLLGWPHLGLHMPLGRARAAYRLIGRLSSLVVCVGRTIREDIGSAIPDARCRVVPLGIRAAPRPPRPMALPDVGPQAIRVGVVGTVDRRKGADVIAAVIQRVVAQAPDVHVYWAGNGEPALMEKLCRAAEVAGVPHLHFLGHTERVPDFMASMDFLLHPARNETFPRVLLEGAMCERAVIATACGGGQEIVQDGVTGLVVPVDDVDGLAAAVVTLARDPETRRRMGATGHAYAMGFPLARYQSGMQQAIIDAHERGPAIGGTWLPHVATGLLTLPGTLAPRLRSWSGRPLRTGADR